MTGGRSKKGEATRIGTGDRSSAVQQRETARGFLWDLLPAEVPAAWTDLEKAVLPVYAAYYREVMPPKRREDWHPVVRDGRVGYIGRSGRVVPVGRDGRLTVFRPTIAKRWRVLGNSKWCMLAPEKSADWNAGGMSRIEAIRAGSEKLRRENMPDAVVNAIEGWAKRWSLGEAWICERVNRDLRLACDHRGGAYLERHAPDMDPHRHKPHEHQWPWERDDPPRELWEFAHTIKLDGFLPNNDTPSEWKREALAEAMQALGDALDEHIAAVQAVARTPKTLAWPQARDHLTWLLLYQVAGLSQPKVAEQAGRSLDAVREGIEKARGLVELKPTQRQGRPRTR